MFCQWCEEEIEPGQRCGHFVEGSDFHHECAVRATLGSVGHLLYVCSCYGGDLEDPPGMNRRHAAYAAMRVLRFKNAGLLGLLARTALVLFYFGEPGLNKMEECNGPADEAGDSGRPG